MSAVIVRDRNLALINPALEGLRTDLGRGAGTYLTWKNIRAHADRVHIAQQLGTWTWMRSITVVACKRELTPGAMTVHQMYLYQFRFILERLSWLARQTGEVASYTLAHIKGFKLSMLRTYESALQGQATQIDWRHLDPAGGSLDQPQRNENLQLADLLVSAQAPAFSLDRFGNTEIRYLTHTAPVIYRHGGNLTSYGLKIHPWNTNTKAAYPWVATL